MDPIDPSSSVPFTIVGVGASAGGLEALTQLVTALPAHAGIALVLVQHLSPQHESAMPALLQQHTAMPVVQVTDGMAIEPNRVYVIPPNVQMGISDTQLFLTPRPAGRSQYTPVDFFFASLAAAAQHHAVGVILSGTASDGAVGVREIKAAGGITIAQRPDTARYNGMPTAAINTGMVDLILTPEEIAGKLAELADHPYLATERPHLRPDDDLPVSQEQLDTVCALLLPVSGVDFKLYKSPTIKRRLQRRMALHRLSTVDDYIKMLRDNPGEITNLYHDILIHVTRFFRDHESFDVLTRQVFPEIFESRSHDRPVRFWVSGCSTGEEAYSLAIEVVDYLGDRQADIRVQIFATDISEAAIEHARNGVYPPDIASDVPAERLRRHFTKVDGGYRVNKALRDLCIFAKQDLTRDPPFSRLDLILCRNVLIYMSGPLQQRLLSTFHYALRPSGFLVLGQAETIGAHADLFATVDKKHRVFRNKAGDASAPVAFSAPHTTSPLTQALPAGFDVRADARIVQNEANRLMLDRYAPPAVVVDQELQIVQFRGRTGMFLEPAPGEASLNLLKMAREGLLYGLRTALQASCKSKRAVRKEGLRVNTDGGWREVHVEIVPLEIQSGAHRQYYVVFFETGDGSHQRPRRGRGRTRADGKPSPADVRDTARSERLQQELAATRDYLQSIIQEVEAANEELQSANEEILSSNEELQSTNEELDTAKEELQSTNEELNTVNEELHGRNDELSRLNSDLINLLSSVQIAIVIVARDLRIRRFTPMAERVLNLIPTDLGRPIVQINPNIDCPDLGQLISEVIDQVATLERDVQDRDGHWFSLRIRPYKDVDNRIDGAVLSLFDIDIVKRHDEKIRQTQAQADAIIDLLGRPALVVGPDWRVQSVSRAFCERFGCAADEIAGRPLDEIQQGAWSFPELRALVDAARADGARPRERRMTRAFPVIGSQTAVISARAFDREGGTGVIVLVALEADEAPIDQGIGGR